MVPRQKGQGWTHMASAHHPAPQIWSGIAHRHPPTLTLAFAVNALTNPAYTAGSCLGATHSHLHHGACFLQSDGSMAAAGRPSYSQRSLISALVDDFVHKFVCMLQAISISSVPFIYDTISVFVLHQKYGSAIPRFRGPFPLTCATSCPVKQQRELQFQGPSLSTLCFNGINGIGPHPGAKRRRVLSDSSTRLDLHHIPAQYQSEGRVLHS